MIGAKHEPSAEEEGDVEYPRADDEPDDARQGEAEGDEQHVVFVEVAEESEEPTPLAKHCQPDEDAGQVHQG